MFASFRYDNGIFAIANTRASIVSEIVKIEAKAFDIDGGHFIMEFQCDCMHYFYFYFYSQDFATLLISLKRVRREKDIKFVDL